MRRANHGPAGRGKDKVDKSLTPFRRLILLALLPSSRLVLRGHWSLTPHIVATGNGRLLVNLQALGHD
jgi:hypothetical protein